MNRGSALVALILVVSTALTGCSTGAPSISPIATTVTSGATTAPTPPSLASASASSSTPSLAAAVIVTAVPAPPLETPLPANDRLLSPLPAKPTRPPPPLRPDDGTILTYARGPSGRLEVALTFDAGADTGYAAQILDLLRDDGIHATFGMTGLWAQTNPDLVKRMVAEGHQLINHTWDHASLTGASTGKDVMTYEQLTKELADTEDLIHELTGYELKPYFRPPYGDIGPITGGYLARAGYYVNVMWSCDSFGWNGFGADQIVDRCTSAERGGPGAIILMHIGAGAAGDFEALPDLIDYYRSQGYAFVTVEQMLQP